MRRFTSAVAIGALSLSLVACDQETLLSSAQRAADIAASATATPTPSEAPAEQPAVQAVELRDGWVHAKLDTGTESAIFGTLVNNTDKPINLVDFSTSLDGAYYELHEIVDGTMREKEGGFVLAPNSEYPLTMTADHLMILGYSQAINEGDIISATVVDEEGHSYEFTTIPARRP